MTDERSAEPILYVEDDPAVRAVTMRWLARQGHPVVAFHDGREALEAFERLGGAVGLAILDIDLPGMDGLALAHAIHDRDPAIPLLFVSDAGGRPIEGLGDRWRALPKPYGGPALLDAVHELLDDGRT